MQTLLKVFDSLTARGATVVVIEHDLDVIRNADWCIDMGPGGGVYGGEIVACGTPEDIADAALFLASDRASFLTGQVLGVNGGMVI